MRIKFLTLIVIFLLWAPFTLAQKFETKMAPDFTLPDINGNTVTLSKYYGQGPTYISFWATWCKPCLEELKIIQKLYKKYQDRGFRVLAIDMEGPKAQGKIKSVTSSLGFTFNILLDNDGEVFRRKFKGSVTPYSFLIDTQGKIVFSAVGFKPGDEGKIEKLIVENLPAPPDTSGKY